MKRLFALLLGLMMLSTLLARADVKYVTETQLKFQGAMGTVMKLFGAAKPTKTVEYYKGNTKRSDSFDDKGNLVSSQIIDLDKELFINIDHKDKSYTQMTFAEMKELAQSALGDLQNAEGQEETSEEKPEANVDWDFKVDINETGETETIGGKKCDKVVMVLDMDAEVTPEEAAETETESVKTGMVVTSTHWVYRGGDATKKEMEAFNIKLAEKFGMLPEKADLKQMMQGIMQSNPELAEAMEKMQKEGKKLNGVSMRVSTIYETKNDPETVRKMREEQAKEEKEEKMEIPTSVGGLLGGFGKKVIKQKLEKKNEVKERNTLMTTETNVLAFESPRLDGSLFQVPAGYKLKTND